MAVVYSCTVRRIRCALAAQSPRRAASSLAPRRPHLGALSVPARLASRSARIITVLTGRRIRRAAAVFQGVLLLLELLDEARELVRSPAHGAPGGGAGTRTGRSRGTRRGGRQRRRRRGSALPTPAPRRRPA